MLAGIAALSGCTTLQNNPEAVTRVCDTVSYDVTDELLADKPTRRQAFEQALVSLKNVQAQPVMDLQAVLNILRQIPVNALQSRRARIGFDTGELIIVLAGDPAINPKSEVTLRAAVAGFIKGIGRRLAML